MTLMIHATFRAGDLAQFERALEEFHAAMTAPPAGFLSFRLRSFTDDNSRLAIFEEWRCREDYEQFRTGHADLRAVFFREAGISLDDFEIWFWESCGVRDVSGPSEWHPAVGDVPGVTASTMQS